MKIDAAIAQLERVKAKHGNVEVYFDCPKCRESFTPNTVVGSAVHLTQKSAGITPATAPSQEP